MDRSAIILAEDSQGKFSEDKAFLNLDNKRLLNHVVDSVKGFVGEVLVVTSSIEQSDLYAKLVSSAKVKFVVSDGEPQGDLASCPSGF